MWDIINHKTNPVNFKDLLNSRRESFGKTTNSPRIHACIRRCMWENVILHEIESIYQMLKHLSRSLQCLLSFLDQRWFIQYMQNFSLTLIFSLNPPACYLCLCLNKNFFCLLRSLAGLQRERQNSLVYLPGASHIFRFSSMRANTFLGNLQ